MEIEELKRRIAEKEEKIEKIEKAIKKYSQFASPELIKACKEHNYEEYKKLENTYAKNDKYYYAGDLWNKYNDLREAQEIVDKYKLSIQKQINQEEAPKIKELWDFLTTWEEKVKVWYHNSTELVIDYMNEYKDRFLKYLEDNNYNFSDKYNYSAKNKLDKEFNLLVNKELGLDKWNRVYDAETYAFVKTNSNNITRYANIRWENESNKYNNDDYIFGKYVLKSFNDELLNKDVAKEKIAKYTDLVERVTAYTGLIQDCSDLSVGNKVGELNGLIKGEKANVYVETIIASGPVQIPHYRIILHKGKNING